VGPPKPGRIPTTKPTAMPIIIKLKVDQLKTWRSPELSALNISTIRVYLYAIQRFNGTG
jgi:hypothetical protein